MRLLGWRDDVAALLREGYAGVAGMGRVVLEASALGLPCVLAGYEHLHGLVTPARFPSIAFSNFSGRGVAPVTEASALAAELRGYDQATRLGLRRLVEAHHDEAKVARVNESLLSAAKVVEAGRAGLLQLYALLRRSEPSQTPWALDHAIALGLQNLTRRPGIPTVGATLEQAAALVETRTRRVVTEQHQQLAAQLAELRSAVASLSERVDAIAQRQAQTPLRLVWRLAKEGTPSPLKRTVRPLTARLRALLKP